MNIYSEIFDDILHSNMWWKDARAYSDASKLAWCYPLFFKKLDLA